MQPQTREKGHYIKAKTSTIVSLKYHNKVVTNYSLKLEDYFYNIVSSY